jgi:hypothetical protein
MNVHWFTVNIRSSLRKRGDSKFRPTEVDLNLRSRRVFPSSVMSTSSVSAVYRSTGPRLKTSVNFGMEKIGQPLLFLWRQVCHDHIWGSTESYSSLGQVGIRWNNGICHDDPRCILASVLQDDIAAIWLNGGPQFRGPENLVAERIPGCSEEGIYMQTIIRNVVYIP